MAFLSDIQGQLDTFAAASEVERDEVRVRLTLADGSSILIRGLQANDAPTQNGWGMIHGLDTPDPQTEALVIREMHVIKAEFQLAPSERRPIGFQSETSD